MTISYDHLVTSAIFLISIIVIKYVTTGFVNFSKTLGWESRRRILVNTNTLLTLSVLIGLTLIWSNELEALALSFMAVAVAIVIATKELIMCFTGTLYKGFSNPFHIGDRIEIGGVRGDVIDRSLFSTKLLEIGPNEQTHQYTGRSVTLPNSLFLTQQVINESYLQDYVLHVFSLPLPIDVNWNRAEAIMLNVADQECSQYYEIAQSYIHKIQKKANLEVLDVKPRVHLKISTYQQINMIVRIAVPARGKGQIEQKIVKKFWSESPLIDAGSMV